MSISLFAVATRWIFNVTFFFPPLTEGCSESQDAFRFFFKSVEIRISSVFFALSLSIFST